MYVMKKIGKNRNAFSFVCRLRLPIQPVESKMHKSNEKSIFSVSISKTIVHTYFGVLHLQRFQASKQIDFFSYIFWTDLKTLFSVFEKKHTKYVTKSTQSSKLNRFQQLVLRQNQHFLIIIIIVFIFIYYIKK